MPKFRVSCSVTIDGKIEIEAKDREAAAVAAELFAWDMINSEDNPPDIENVEVIDIQEIK